MAETGTWKGPPWCGMKAKQQMSLRGVYEEHCSKAGGCDRVYERLVMDLGLWEVCLVKAGLDHCRVFYFYDGGVGESCDAVDRPGWLRGRRGVENGVERGPGLRVEHEQG